MIPFSDADAQRRSLPVVNLVLIGLNALVFLYELQLGGLGLLGGGGSRDIAVFFSKWGFIPDEVASGASYPGIIETPVPNWATVFSYMFLHGGLMHFAGNMAFLWVLGDNIENRLGHIKYLLFYLVTGVAAALSQLAIDPHSQAPLIGASGAVSGVVGAYLMLYPYNRIKALIVFYFITVVEVRALVLLGLWSLWQLIQALFSLGLSNAVSVAFFAHVGGVLAGAAIIAVYKLLTRQPVWPSRRRQQPWDYWYRTGRGPD